MTERYQTAGVNVLTTPLDRAAAVCLSYTADWRGGRTGPDAYLTRVPTGERPTLLRNLLEYEVRGPPPGRRPASLEGVLAPAPARVRGHRSPRVPGLEQRVGGRDRSSRRLPNGRADWPRPPAGWATTGWSGNSAGAGWGRCSRPSTWAAATGWP